MESYTGIHQLLCKGCQKAPLHYRCVRWRSNDDPRLVSWNCQGCLPSSALEYCPECIRNRRAPNEALPPPSEFPTTQEVFRAGITRTGCGNCRKEKIQCSRLHTTASKCVHCLEHDLDCDCKVVRMTCEYCRERWLKCCGNEDNCTNCIRLDLECKPHNRRRATRPVVKDAQATPAEDSLDVIDGMKASLAFDSCLSCEENPMFRCDRELGGCAHCRIKKQPCEYPSLAGTLAADRMSRYCTACYRRKSLHTKGPLCDLCKSTETEKQKSKLIEQCHACRVRQTDCDDSGTCARCRRLGLECLRGLPFQTSQSRLSSEFKMPSPYTAPGVAPSNSSGANQSYTRAGGARSGIPDMTRGSLDMNFRVPSPPSSTRSNINSVEKCHHVEGPCSCERGRSNVEARYSVGIVLPPPPHIRSRTTNSWYHHCKMGDVNCTPQSLCRDCKLMVPQTPRVERTCAACRSVRTRCDGRFPICATCEKHGRYCSYRPGVIGKTERAGNDDKRLSEEHAVAEENEAVVESERLPIEQGVEDKADASKDQNAMDDITTNLTDLDVEDWCVVTAADADGVGVVERDMTEKVTSRSYKFW